MLFAMFHFPVSINPIC